MNTSFYLYYVYNVNIRVDIRVSINIRISKYGKKISHIQL